MGSRSTNRLRLAALLGAVSASAAAFTGPALGHGGNREAAHIRAGAGWPRVQYPSARSILNTERFAASHGDVAFAVLDDSIGLRGYDSDEQFSSASVSKALLLAAELRRLDREGQPLDQGTKDLLEPMITYSDNGAADAVYSEVGDDGLEEVAERAAMRDFEPTPGFWGGDQITAADMARFFYRLEANLPGPHRAYAKSLLARITPVERWGIPAVIGHGWSVWFKGGWRPAGQKNTSGAVTHQAALLVHRGGERVALAVLTNEPPGDDTGYGAIEGVTKRLLAKPPPWRRGWLAP